MLNKFHYSLNRKQKAKKTVKAIKTQIINNLRLASTNNLIIYQNQEPET